MEKARLTKEQAELLEKFKKEYVTEEEILENKFQNFIHDRDDHALKHIPVRTLAIALYVGYEIIEEDQKVVITKETRESIMKLFICDKGSREFEEGFLLGVKRVLQLTGIKVNGLNN